MSFRDDDYTEPAEHECPTALERPAAEFNLGGVFWSPAGRWETIQDLAGRADYSAQVTIHTDRCTWTFWRSNKYPYADGWKLQPGHVSVLEAHSSYMEIVIGSAGQRTIFGRGHVLASARQVRGTGWEITDRSDGGPGEPERVIKSSKAAARAEMNRRARAHAKRLGVQVHGGAA